MSKNWFFLFLLLRFIVQGIIGLYITVIFGVITVLLTKNLLFQVNFTNIFFLPIKTILTGGIIGGIAAWIWFILRYNQSNKRGKESLENLINNDYKVEINEISPVPKVPFYRINGELFYNYAPFARNMGVMLSGIKKIAKHAEPKNIVINLVDSSVKFEKLKKMLFKNFDNKFNKIIIIDKAKNVIKIKDGDWLNLNLQNLLYQCPCCKNHTLNRQGKEETCPICGWIDDPLQSLDPYYANGLNKVSLIDAQKNYLNKE